jgi:CDP-paratose 2-epimerase
MISRDGDATTVSQEPEVARRDRPVLITGGAGFIGCNLAHRLLSMGKRVILFDNLSRNGVRRNLAWLRRTHGESVEAVIGDVRDADAVAAAVERAGRVFHFAAQVAVTTSLVDPLEDFSVNARGTLNVLEAIRQTDHRPPLVFTSTNKVYGGLDDIPLVNDGARYGPRDEEIARRGVGESRPLDFHSPYGCSKGTADQYVVDYARSYGLKTAVFRMSCIYGPHQFGTEDQGWVAHFLIRALENEPIVLYGDGRQVRDVLFVEDLVEAMWLAQLNIDRIAGQAFNMGGGPARTISLLELLDMIGTLHGRRPDITFNAWRTGDQRYYVSDTSKFAAATGWKQTVDVHAGVSRLYEWLRENANANAEAHRPARRRDRAAEPLAGVAESAHPASLLQSRSL